MEVFQAGGGGVLTKLESTPELGNSLFQTLHSPNQSWPTTERGAESSMYSCVQNAKLIQWQTSTNIMKI